MLIQPEGMSDKDWIVLQSRYIEALSILQKTEGWAMFNEYLVGEERRLLGELAIVKDGDSALRAAAAYTVMKNVREWVPKLGEALTKNLRK